MITKAYQRFQEEVNGLASPKSVPVIHSNLTALQFHQRFVALNQPCLFKGLASSWPAVKTWSTPYLEKCAGGLEVSVEVTPNGLADVIVMDPKHGSVFALPCTERMKFKEYLVASQPISGGTAYVSHQNSRCAEIDK